MQIAILSDTHSRQETVKAVLGILKKRKIRRVLHCGDIEDAETVRLFHKFTTHFVFGNTDWDKDSLRSAIKETGATLHEPFGNLEWGGCKIAWIHGDDKRLLHDLEASEHFDFLFYGHTHQAEQHRTGPTLVVNPGALHRSRAKSFVILDLAARQLETVPINQPAD
jgi:uncharacterized protein